jgi:Sec-independent protein translocase protein TatA
MPAGLTSPVHLLVIIVVALVVLGPERLPQALRQVGRTMGDVRRWSDAISGELRDALSLDPGDEAPPAPAPVSVPPPSLNGNASLAPVLAAPPPPAPAFVANVDPTQHPALQEGGEWH